MIIPVRTTRLRGRAAVLGLLLALAMPAHAAYVLRYNSIVNGAVAFTGNTLGLNKANNTNAPGTAGGIGAFITQNTALQDGSYPPGTTNDWTLNGSAAQLSLPAGSTVLYAELIWSGSYSYGGENVAGSLGSAVQFVTPLGTFNVSPAPATATTLGTAGGGGTCSSTIPCFYVRSADVTNLVRNAGAGSYVTGRVPATQGNSDNNSNTAGWTLAVVYQNGSLPSRNLTVYVGAEVTNGTIQTTATVSGFCTPTSGIQSGRLLVSALEGDPQITGDQMRFGPTAGTLVPLSGSNNPVGNFFASQINGALGLRDTSGSFGGSNSTPGSGTSGARQGYDITSIDVSATLTTAQTSAVARGTSTGDQYVINALGLQIQVGAPVFLVPVKAVDKPVAVIGDVLTYTIRLDNTTGTADALNVRFRDAIPAGTSFVANSFRIGNAVQPGADPTVGVDIGNVAVGGSVTVRYQVRVDSIPAAPATAQYQETSRWTYNFISCAGQPVTAGVTTTNPVVTQIARLAASKSVSPSGPVLAGQALTYTITATNDGTAASAGSTLRDAIPAGTMYVPGSTTLNGVAVPDSGGAPFASTRAINSAGQPAGQISVGASAVVSFQVRVNAGFAGDIVNTASVDVDGSGAAPPVTAQATNTSRLAPDLSLAKQAIGAFTRGANGVFALTVSNGATAGSTNGTAVTVTDSLPVGLALVGTPTGSGWLCTPTGNAFSCARSDVLAPGASYPPVTVNVAVAQDAPASLTNTASVQGGGDATASPGSATVGTAGSADLGLAKSVDNANPSIGQNVVFTLTASNAGPSDATAVVVTDALPAGLTFVSAMTQTGNYDSGTGQWAVGNLPRNATATLRITATFTGPAQVTNVASIAAAETDPNAGNNTAQVTVPSQVADLSLTKGVTNASPTVGANVQFTVTLRNAGPAAATGVVVRDALPTGLTFVSANASQGGYANGTGLWTVGTVNAGADATLTLTATVNAVAAVTNVAEVSASDQFDPNSRPNNNNPLENDQGSATVTPQGADLSLSKGVDRPNPNIGDTIAYTLTVGNAGPGVAPGVTVTELLPTGLTFISSTATQGSYASGTGVWAVGTVAPGASPQLVIRARFDGPGQITNTATVTSPLPDPDPSNNSAQRTVPSQIADLSLGKSVDVLLPDVGSNVTFTLLAANAGPNSATGVEVADLLPAGLDFVSATAGQGTYDAPTGRWTVGTLTAGSVASLQLVARVSRADAVSNSAQVSRVDQFDPDSTPGNGNAGEDDQASAQVRPQSADLAIAKRVNVANPNIGDPVVFTVTVSNAGPTAAQAVNVTERLPAGLTFSSASATRGSYDSAAGLWNIGALASGATADLTLNAVFAGPSQVRNTASVASSTPDANPANNTASVLVPSQVADLSLSKAASTQSPNVGDAVSFTLRVANAGPDSATRVRVADRLPAGLSFVSSTATQGTYAAGSGEWNVGTVASGASATLTLVARVDGATVVTNIAEIAGSEQFDPNSQPGNANASENDQASVTLVPQSADLAVAKSVDRPNPNVGETVRFRLTASNAGPTAATGVVVQDLLPAGLTFVSATASVGTYNASTGAWTLGTLNNAQTATLDMVVRFDGPGQVTNAATITATTPDPNTANNRSSLAIPSQIADLSLAKSVSDAAPGVGAAVTFTVTLANAGPNAATGVQVGDPLPAGLALLSQSTSQGNYNPATGIWNLGTVASGQLATLTLVTRVDAVGAVANTAQVVASDQFDPNSTPNNSNPGENDQARVVLSPRSADLSLSKGVNIANPNIGDSIVFSLRVSNAGPAAATGTQVDDRLPPGLTFLSAAASQGSYDGVAGVWDVGTVAAGGSATLAVTARFDGPGQVQNRAEARSDVPDLDPSNNRAQVSVPSQVADLSLTKTANVAAPSRGENVTFTIRATNAGPNAATGVRVAEPLDSDLAFVSASASQGNYNPATGVWEVGSIASGATGTLTLTATVTGVGEISNTVEVLAVDQFDPDSVPNNGNAAEDDRATLRLAAQSVDLAIGKTASSIAPNVGDVFDYVVAVRNAGPSNATGVVISDPLPAGVTLQQATTSIGVYDAATGRWQVGTVIAGGSATLTLRARMDVATPVTNTAAVAAVDQPDSNPGNDRDSITLPQQFADVSLAKAVSNATPDVGGAVTYTLTVSNAGPNAATALQVTDRLPAGLEFVEAQAGQGSYAAASGLWTVGDLPNGASAALNLVARVLTAGAIDNIAEITNLTQRDPDATPGNNAAGEDDRAVATLTGQSADLSIAKGVDNPSPGIGATIAFTLTASNAGPGAARNVVVDDLLPTGLTFLSATTATGTYASGTGRWSVGQLASGATAQLTISARYDGPSFVTNTATITSDTPDPNSSGNSASVTVPSQIADLSLTKTVSTAAPRIGDALSFTLTVANAGPSPASGVRVADLLPAGLQFIAATTTNGGYDAASGTWSLASPIPAGSQSVLTLQARVTAAGAGANRAQIAASSQFDPDSTPNNGTGAEDDSATASFTATGAALAGAVFIDANGNGQRDAGEPGIADVALTLTGIDANGEPVTRNAVTDATGAFRFTDLPGAGPQGYTLTEIQPGGYQNGATLVGSAGGSPAVNTVSGIPLAAGGNATGYGFAELGSTLSGSVWREATGNRQRESSEAGLAGWNVELVDPATGTVVRTVQTDANGRYQFDGLVPGDYTLRFREPVSNVIWGAPVNGETGVPASGSSLTATRDGLAIRLAPGSNLAGQGLPVDPSGVLYDSVSREVVGGSTVTFCGPAGFVAATQLVGGSSYQPVTGRPNCASMVVGPQGFYQFLLVPGSPAGDYQLAVTPVAGYRTSTGIPAESGALVPPTGTGAYRVQPQSTPPAPGQSTTHYLVITLSGSGRDVINNHIPLDTQTPAQIVVSKVASASEAELGDSIAYEIRVQSVSGPSLPQVLVTDNLPAGFRYIAGTARIQTGNRAVRVLADPAGQPGPQLQFLLLPAPGLTAALPSGETLVIRYRLRVGVGAQQGDGINRARAASGFVTSNEAKARVKVSGGVFAPQACLVGKIYLDCNQNRVQDHEEVGVPGVRFYLEDGTYLVSDVEGKYSFCGISPTTHVLKADATTLPVGAALDTLDNRNAGDPDSRFLDPRNGELHRGDFAIRNCSVEVKRQVMGRRTQGEVQVPDEEKRNPSAETLDTRRDVRPQWPRGAAPPAYANEEAPK